MSKIVAEYTLGSVKIEELINSLVNKLAHVAAKTINDTLIYVHVNEVVEKVPHTLTEMKAKALVDSFIETLAKEKA